VYGGTEKLQGDPHWRDYILFYEYFHGDNGAGIGASHQTRWTGCVAQIILINALITQEVLYAPNTENSVLRKAKATSGKAVAPVKR
jgi:hypothetical protein